MEDSEEYIFNLPQEELEITAAPLLKRVLAYVIDFLIFYFVFFSLFMQVYWPLTGLPVLSNIDAYELFFAQNPGAYAKIVVGFVTALFTFLFYFMLTERFFGASVGKRLLKLEVIPSNHQILNYSQLFFRSLTKSVLLPFFLFDIIGIFVTKDRQRFSEIISNTKVIYSPKLELVYEVYE